MNLNLINKYCDEWTKADWQDAYDQYCKHNMYGPKTKREYYEFVKERHKRLKLTEEPLSPELANTWSVGRRNARLWAKKHGCDMNGRLLTDIAKENTVQSAMTTAERAEEIAIDSKNRLDHLIEIAKKRKQ